MISNTAKRAAQGGPRGQVWKPLPLKNHFDSTKNFSMNNS